MAELGRTYTKGKIDTLLGGKADATDIVITSAESIGLAPGNTASANRTALLSLSDSDLHVLIPSGDYLIDNSGTAINITDFNGRLTFAPAARFVFTDNAKRGVVFTEGTHVLDGWNATYQTTPTARVSAQASLGMALTVDCRVWGARIDKSPCQGIEAEQCVRLHIIKPVVTNTRADGIYAINCEDYRLIDPTTNFTSDDGVSFHSYGDKPDLHGGEIRGVTVRNSDARGVCILGQRDVTVEINLIENTNASGVFVGFDSTVQSRMPRGVKVSGGTVRKAGHYDDTTNEQPRATVNYGMWANANVAVWAASTTLAVGAIRRPTTSNAHIYRVSSITTGITAGSEPTWPTGTEATVTDGGVTWTEHGSDEFEASFSDITFEEPYTRGCKVNVTRGEVRLANLQVIKAGGNAYELVAERIYVDNCVADRSTDTGFLFWNCAEVHYSNLVMRNVATAASHKRAFQLVIDSASNYTDHRFQGESMEIWDSQATPTGHSVYLPTPAGGKTLNGQLGKIDWDIDVPLTTTPGLLELTYALPYTQGVIRQGAYYSRATALPAAGYWHKGMRVKNSASGLTTGGVSEWECITAGAPGGWQVLSQLKPVESVSADRGDTSPTLTMTDATIQRFATTLTANRTVTLPASGGYNGARFRIVRTGLGAFTLDVGGLKTIPSATAAWVDVTHNGTAWVLTGYGTL